MTSDPAIAAEVAAMDEAFTRHINAGDADPLIEGSYTEDAILLPPGQDRVRGNKNVRQSLRELIEAGVADFRLETKLSGHSRDLRCSPWQKSDGSRYGSVAPDARRRADCDAGTPLRSGNNADGVTPP